MVESREAFPSQNVYDDVCDVFGGVNPPLQTKIKRNFKAYVLVCCHAGSGLVLRYHVCSLLLLLFHMGLWERFSFQLSLSKRWLDENDICSGFCFMFEFGLRISSLYVLSRY